MTHRNRDGASKLFCKHFMGWFFHLPSFWPATRVLCSMPGGELRQRILAVEMLLCIEPRVCWLLLRGAAFWACFKCVFSLKHHGHVFFWHPQMLESYQIWTFKSSWGKCRRLRFTTSGTWRVRNGKPRGRLGRSCCPKTWLNLLISPRVSWIDKYQQISTVDDWKPHILETMKRWVFNEFHTLFYQQKKQTCNAFPCLKQLRSPSCSSHPREHQRWGANAASCQTGYPKYQNWTTWLLIGSPLCPHQSEIFQISRDHLEIIQLKISSKALCQCAPRGFWWGFPEMLWAGFVGLVQCSLDILCRFERGTWFLDSNEWKNTPGPSQNFPKIVGMLPQQFSSIRIPWTPQEVSKRKEEDLEWWPVMALWNSEAQQLPALKLRYRDFSQWQRSRALENSSRMAHWQAGEMGLQGVRGRQQCEEPNV